MSTLSNVTSLLNSKLVRDRHEGITQLRSALGTDHAIDKLKPNDWIVLFAALFEAFSKEKQACKDKSLLHSVPTGTGAALVRRLTEVASAVRFLVEKGVKVFNTALRKQILDHIVANIKHQGRLIESIALDYVKSMKALLSYAPHLDHLGDRDWITLARLSFNVILEDSFRKELELEPEDESQAELSDEEADEPPASVASPRKRRRVEPSRVLVSPAPSTPKSLPVSLEKIEFASLLSMLLRAPNAPIVSKQHPHLAANILNRLERFLVQYPADTSLHHDYLLALSATLSQVALNDRERTIKFAKATWHALVGMWSAKNQRLKEDLVVILRVLFPYFTYALDEGDCDDGLLRLWRLLGGEAQSRWGVDSLSMDSLRFEVVEAENDSISAFVAKTFRYGWHFESNQALAWAILELHADCGEKLYRLSESVHAIGGQSSKRRKMDNPIDVILNSIRTSLPVAVRTFHFQALLFFIDRHWAILHTSLQQDVTRTLTQCLSDDDPSTQSWSFVCLAAIAHFDGSTQIATDINMTCRNRWDTVWTFAMRRANVPAVYRAACHTARVLLRHGKTLLSPQRMLAEIETLAKDLDVQGPSAPSDSVCEFLVLCMRTAAQDVSLYRLRLEDKVLAWLVDNWRPSSVSRRLAQYTIQDILNLLGVVCAFTEQPDLVCNIMLPDCAVVAGMKENVAIAVIRDFSLHAELPTFRKPTESSLGPQVLSIEAIDDSAVTPPGPRERKISSFFLKSLDVVAQDWDVQKDVSTLPPAEKVRSVLDLSITAMFYEGLLRVNGTQSNRRVIQAACRAIAYALPYLSDQRWTLSELMLVLDSFAPLHYAEPPQKSESPWELLLPPGRLSGIRTEMLRTLTRNGPTPEERKTESRRILQRSLFRSSDIQDLSASVVKSARTILQVIVDRIFPSEDRRVSNENARDGFAGLHISTDSIPFARSAAGSPVLRAIMDACFAMAATFPLLYSSSGEPTRDRELMHWFEEAVCTDDSHEAFFAVLPSLIRSVEARTLYLSTSSLTSIFELLGDLVRTYNYRKNDDVKLLTAGLLRSTMHIWLDPARVQGEENSFAPHLVKWLVDNYGQGGTLGWSTRDSILSLFSEYMERDPTLSAYKELMDDDEQPPHAVMPRFTEDDDIRVRFRAAPANARLLYHASTLGVRPMVMYTLVHRFLSLEYLEFGMMLSRFLTLANLMVVSSAVRRGPYWHLLEISLVTEMYNQHLTSILRGIADRIGLPHFSALFDIYGSQIATSVLKAGKDFSVFPPHLLGFRSRSECTERTFAICTPLYLVAHLSQDSFETGRQQFVNHCRMVRKNIDAGLMECLPEIIGYHMVFWIHNNLRTSPENYPDTTRLWKPILQELYEAGTFDRHLRGCADRVITAILRTLQDHDFSPDGSIVKALKAYSSPAAEVFERLSSRRALKLDDYDEASPGFSAVVVLRALDWFSRTVHEVGQCPVTHHVLHHVFSALGEAYLLSDQVRLFNALCLWIACHDDHFADTTLLQTLLNGAANLVGQVDMAREAQSILEWALTTFSEKLQGIRLTEVLLRVACVAHEYSLGTTEDVITLGLELLDWIEDIICALAKRRTLLSTIRRTLLAWPRDCPRRLQQLIAKPSLKDLQVILSDNRISSNKFRMVRQIYALAEAGDYEDDAFSKHDFWQLRQVMPLEKSLLGDELQAFISLLVSQRGRIDGLNRETTVTQTAHLRYLQQRQKEPQLEQGLLARKAIISSLCARLDDSVASQVYLAFQTLRALVATTLDDVAGFNGWPVEHVAELHFLKAYSQLVKPRPLPNLAQLLQEDESICLSENYPQWITFFATALSDVLSAADPFYGPLSLILHKDGQFAEEALPILVHIYLFTDTSRMDDSRTPARDIISKYFARLLGFTSASKACRKALVDTVLHLREWPPPDFRDPLAYDKWLTVDFVVLSQNAVTYGAYTTALLFLELATEYAKDEAIAADLREEVLYQIYRHIDEPDGFYAISTKDVHSLLVKRLHHENQWDKAFQFHGAALEIDKPDPACANGVLQALHSFGFDSLAMSTLQTLPGAEALVDTQMTYELGWRAGVWDLPKVTHGDDTAASLYLALRAVYRERDLQTVRSVVLEQLRHQMGYLKRLGYENLVEIRQVTQTLMCLDEIRRWCQTDVQAELHSSMSVAPINDAYFSEAPRSVEFSDLQSILATRISLLRSSRQQEERLQIGDMATPLGERLKAYETSCLLQLSRAARDAGHAQIAINSVVQAQRLNGKEHFDVAYEFANVLWLTKEPQMANAFLKELLSTSSRTPPQSTYTSRAALLALMGNWASQACLEKPIEIKDHYFDAAIKAMQGESPGDRSSIYHEYATFSERQYHAIVKSPDVLRLKVYIDRKTAEIKYRDDQLKTQSGGVKEREMLSHKKKAEKLLKTDQALYTEYLKSRDAFLQQAIQMYSRCLASSDAFDDDTAIRISSLWFANFDNTDKNLPTAIGVALGHVPSHKFVFLAHQLSARLSNAENANDKSSNQVNLRKLVTRMCREHPFHALFPVYCLKSDAGGSRPSRQSLGSQGSMSQIVRAGAANEILARLRAEAACAQRVADVQKVCDASLQWAKFAIKPAAGKSSQVKHQQIEKKLAISQLENVRVPVITKHTPLDPTGRYEDCVWITRYDSTYETAGGINLPKICYCIGSDGRKYKQLFKGEGGDDLRQDAVMEQVFDLVNILLRKDRESTRRNLRIRGYKVIPLATQAGVIEFVEKTTTLNSWLPRAHMRYRPDDLTPTQFHSEMSGLRHQFGTPEKVDPEQMTKLFVKLRERFHPVMRHYFTELTKNPSEWFKMRLYYARSVATTSIVGHIIGLGDRHLSNILLDKESGEVIHIDLGIAFEQGKLLPVVERVPFRLTADMVDGLGSTGTQGVFQRCAEHTLRVLRDRSDVILTVLEVFKYDPLHSWTASDLKLQGVQSVASRDRAVEEQSTRDGADEALNHIVGFNVSTATGADEAADRALSTVARKLDKALSVEFTVNELIAEATDVVNLANMFPGWAPHQ